MLDPISAQAQIRRVREHVTVIRYQPDAAGSTFEVYDVVRSTDPSNFSGAACIETGDSDTLATDAALPLSGELYCYLVQPRNGCGATLGTNSSGNPRPTVTCP